MFPEQRRRRREYDRDKDRDWDRDRDRGKDRDWDASSPRSERKDRPRLSQQGKLSSSRDKDRQRDALRKTSRSSSSSESQTYSPRKSSSSRTSDRDHRTPSTFLERTRSSQSYPSFSKAHSRESISKPDNSSRPPSVPYTPDPTDLNGEKNGSPRSSRRKTTTVGAPPSPPLTTVEPNLSTTMSGGSLRPSKTRLTGQRENARRSLDILNSHSEGVRFSASRYSLREAEEGRRSVIVNSASTSGGEKSEARQPSETFGETSRSSRSPFHGSPTRTAPSRSVSGVPRNITTLESTVDSDATPIPQNPKRNGVAATPITNPDQLAASESVSQHDVRENGRAPKIEVFAAVGSESEFAEPIDLLDPMSPEANFQPPPPPPPALEPKDIPRVDYLLQNGGLTNVLPRSFSTSAQSEIQLRPQPTDPNSATNAAMQSVFAPYLVVLDSLEKVIVKGGSVAVATGYRSVARRLLERLEAVFARNISNEVCTCIMCQMDDHQLEATAEHTGVSWGEIFELVSGRKELPPWPPFSLPTNATGLGISDLEQMAPMQKLDVDVPEEYREHYLRQSKKTKHAVQNWLEDQPEDGPPTEIDDETITFAMLTYLEPEERRIFTALSRGLGTLPPSRAPTPAYAEPKSDLIVRIGLALQRLYRLSRPPRDTESCMYMLKNPALHNALATLAAISKPEWDVLTSGRFDGFLWSGAEDISQLYQAVPGVTMDGNTPHGSRASSRGPTIRPAPATLQPSLSRTTTPFSPGTATGGVPLPRTNTATPTITQVQPGPVQLDEETEIAMLAEVERDIYLGMEALEDAFELLHLKAEAIRKALVNRSAGLAAGARRRNRPGDGEDGPDGAGMEELNARLGTPVLASNNYGHVSSPVVTPRDNIPPANYNPHAKYPTYQSPSSPAALRQPAPGINLTTQTPDPDWNPSGTFDDTMSLAPDDSASNVGWRERERRQRERNRDHGSGSGGGSGWPSSRDRSGGGSGGGGTAGGGSGTGLSAGARGLSKRLTRRLRTVDVVREEG